MMEWLLELKTIPRFEYIAYWVIAILVGMWGAVGWALYHKPHSILPPSDKAINSTSPTQHPKK